MVALRGPGTTADLIERPSVCPEAIIAPSGVAEPCQFRVRVDHGTNDGRRSCPRADTILDEAIAGWRVWTLGERGTSAADAGRIRRRCVEPRRAVKARCGVSAILLAGIAADIPRRTSDELGIYAASCARDVARPRPAWPPAPVVGVVSLWGTVVEHEGGWRSAVAYPARLRLVCSMCAGRTRHGVPEVVHRFDQKLYTLCGAHRGGISPRRPAHPADRHRPGCPPSEAHRHVRRRSPPPSPCARCSSNPRLVALPYMPTMRVVPVEVRGATRA